MNFTTFMGLLLFLLMSATLIWEFWLRSAARRRRNVRKTARFDAVLREMEACESEVLRERIIGGADILALLDRSNRDRSNRDRSNRDEVAT